MLFGFYPDTTKNYIEPKLFIEEYLNLNADMKFHCIYGEVAVIHYITKNEIYNYTIDWKQLNITRIRSNFRVGHIKKPENLEKMIDIIQQ